MFSNFFFPPSKNHVVYEIMWKKYCTARQATDDKIIRRILFACLITKATETHSEYVILIPFSTAAMVIGTRINITLYVRYLTYLNL